MSVVVVDCQLELHTYLKSWNTRAHPDEINNPRSSRLQNVGQICKAIGGHRVKEQSKRRKKRGAFPGSVDPLFKWFMHCFLNQDSNINTSFVSVKDYSTNVNRPFGANSEV